MVIPVSLFINTSVGNVSSCLLLHFSHVPIIGTGVCFQVIRSVPLKFDSIKVNGFSDFRLTIFSVKYVMVRNFLDLSGT